MTQWKVYILFSVYVFLPNFVQSKLKLPENSTLEHSAARANLKLGLFTYPVLQAADILVHG